MMRKILIFSISGAVFYSHISFSGSKPPGGGGSASSACPRLEGIKGCSPPVPPPPPACTPPDPNAGQPCTGTIYTCTTGSMDLKHIDTQCINPHEECTVPPPSETPTNPICTTVCDSYVDTCSVNTVSCNDCTTSQGSGTIDNCGACVVSGSGSPGNSCGANQTCP